MTLKAQSIKGQTDKLDFIDIKICFSKDTLKRVKTNHKMGENIWKSHI